MTALPPLATADLDHVLDHTQPLWDKLRGQSIFLTGGTGFFGCWLLESFVHANDRLNLDATATVLTRSPAAFRAKVPHLAAHPAVRLIHGDMCDCAGLDVKAACVIHAAAEAWLPSSATRPTEAFDRNVTATRQALELARRCGARRFLFASSGAVYGRQPTEVPRIPEDFAGAPDPLDPLTTYGQAKRVSEFMCAAAARQHGFDAVVARCFAFVGPHLQLDAGYAIGNFIRDALAGGPINVNGDGTPYRSYLYAADLAVWLWTILLRGQPGRAYNVGSDAELPIRQLAGEVRDVAAPRAEVKVAKQAIPGRPTERYVPSIERARRELGLDVWVSRTDAIARTVAWYRDTVRAKTEAGS